MLSFVPAKECALSGLGKREEGSVSPKTSLSCSFHFTLTKSVSGDREQLGRQHKAVIQVIQVLGYSGSDGQVLCHHVRMSTATDDNGTLKVEWVDKCKAKRTFSILWPVHPSLRD